MATVYPELDDRLIAFIAGQPVFFVATAPCLHEDGSGGHVNVSPKGYRDTFAVIDRSTVDLLTRWAERRTPGGLAAYRAGRNALSIDGLPALD